MGEANEGGRSKLGGMENLSLEKYRPRDLLQRLMCSSSSNTTTQQQAAQNAASFDIDLEEEEDAEEEVELNLGLSLGGRFGVDKNANKNKLIRSSSIVGTMPLVRNRNDNGDEETTTFFPPVSSYPNLIRSSSLPTETEEEWRKRKELQTLRRMAAKRRRSEKQRNSAKAEKEDEIRRGDNTDTNTTTTTTFNSVGSPSGLPTWAAATRQALLAGTGADVAMAKSKQYTSQGSVESQGGSSSGMSEMESKLIQGSSSCGEARSPAGHQSSQEGSQENMGPSGTKTSENKCTTSGSKIENPSKSPNAGGNKGREIGMNAMEDMPCVFTKGDGPNGRRIDGILYRYGKGEEVRIMCVCHGKFLSPAEFVKHAGGGDVAHPLRHIVINPSSTSFLS